jgi:hypothetical protein
MESNSTITSITESIPLGNDVFAVPLEALCKTLADKASVPLA